MKEKICKNCRNWRTDNGSCMEAMSPEFGHYIKYGDMMCEYYSEYKSKIMTAADRKALLA